MFWSFMKLFLKSKTLMHYTVRNETGSADGKDRH